MTVATPDLRLYEMLMLRLQDPLYINPFCPVSKQGWGWGPEDRV